MKILLTGAAGFIGFHTARKLLARGDEVVGLDNLNDYYDPTLKRARLAILEREPKFRFVKMDLADKGGMKSLFTREKFKRVIHLAAQAGVRYSLENPQAYVDSNVTGTLNVLEGCRHNGVEHLVFASTSSVYGLNTNMPFSVHRGVDHPLSLYATTKRANELMAHNYAALFKLPVTGLRFFTVYGPWGRPDMAMWLFAKAILAGEPIKLFNNGDMRRDFTYVDDIVESIARLVDRAPAPDPDWSGESPDAGSSNAPWRVYNIGNNNPVELLEVVRLLEEALGVKARRELLPMQPGDVPATYADVDDLMGEVDFKPSTPIGTGIQHFVAWFRDYHRL
jgi:UDP-glucuronate 4-epimerase